MHYSRVYLESIGYELAPVVVSTRELENRLTGSASRFAHEARKLLSWNTACGVYLARLAKKRPERIVNGRTAESREWTILSSR